MADMTLEEALAAATVDSSTDSDILTISNDLRTITIPESIKNLGVESDEDVNRIHFKMQKMYKDVDLSEFDIRINYINGNDGDKYIVEDKTISEDYITFSWLVGRNALKTKGSTRFIVCLKKTDSEGVVQKEFNTTLASINVLEGLETTEQIMQKYPDIIEQILKKIEGSTTITPDQIAEAVENYLIENPIETDKTMSEEGKAADAKEVGDRLSKLSDEIAELKSDLSQLKNDLPNGNSSGSTVAEKTSLVNLLYDVLFTENNISDKWNTFINAWGKPSGGGTVTPPDEPDEPTDATWTLTSIELTLNATQADAGTATSALIQSVVGTYVGSDGSTKTQAITGYTVSPTTIDEGANSVSVSYVGKTSNTIVVTGNTVQSGESEWVYDSEKWIAGYCITDDAGHAVVQSTYNNAKCYGYRSDDFYIPIQGNKLIYTVVDERQELCNFWTNIYDAEKEYIAFKKYNGVTTATIDLIEYPTAKYVAVSLCCFGLGDGQLANDGALISFSD